MRELLAGLRPTALLLIRLLNLLVPKRRQAVVAIYPDSDSSTKLIVDGLRRQGIDVVLVQDQPGLAEGVRTCRVGSPASIRHLLRSRWLVFSHPRFLGMTCRRQRVINVWHGMPIKAIELLDGQGNGVPADLTIAAGPTFVPIVAAAFGVPPASVRVLPHPRHEVLARAAAAGDRRALHALGLGIPSGERVVLWMPTFRGHASATHVDGVRPGLVLDADAVQRLSALLARCGGWLLLRRHPYEASEAPVDAPRIREVTDADLLAAGVGAYDLLADADALISDVSSVWIDYLIADRPTLIYFPDEAAYTAERPLLLDPYPEWTPSPVLRTEQELESELEAVLGGDDPHRERRQTTAARLMTAEPVDSVDRMLVAAERGRRHSLRFQLLRRTGR